MLKIFLVEDEVVVREGIKNNIDWRAHGYEFCGEASDGELAVPLIRKVQPDIVITDIKMPFMDGLTLSRWVKDEFPETEVIFLSGYEEFAYAKSGIQIGVAEYLTKPISGEELIEAVGRVAQEIEERRREQEITNRYRREMEEIFLRERKDLFQFLVSGTKTVPELLELAKTLQIDLSAIWYNLVLITPQATNHTQEEYSNSLIEIEEKWKELNCEKNFILFDRNLEGKALLFRADTREELFQNQQDTLNAIKGVFSGYRNVRYFGGIGRPVNRLRELPISFESACHAYAHRYLNRESRIVDCEEIEQELLSENERFDFVNVDPKQMNKGRICEFLQLGDYDETKYFVEEFFRNLGSNAVKSLIFRQYIVMDIYFCVAEFIDELQVSKEEKEAEKKDLSVAAATLQSEQETMRIVIEMIERTLKLRDKAATDRYGSIVDEVKTYIEEHFADEELSLNTLARRVNFSPNHLSTLFSQETGCTFIKYLTDSRMGRAKQLLRCTGNRSSEIALLVGYKDPHYFSYLFKKTQGMTPTQYRGNVTSR